MTSLQAFDRESINTVVHVPDYRLRQRLSLKHKEAVVVEAFAAFDEMFHLQLRWGEGSNYPELFISSVGARYHRLMLDLAAQSPHFTHSTGEAIYSAAAPQWAPCTWNAPGRPSEVTRPSSVMQLLVDRPPTYHNDINISLDQTVTFTLTGSIWQLDEDPSASLHCKSFRLRKTPGYEAQQHEEEEDAAAFFTSSQIRTARSMMANITAARLLPDVSTDVQLEPDEEEGGGAVSTRGAHAFMLQAQSPVFRRMLVGQMVEATERRVRMTGVRPRELDDLLAAIYRLGVPPEVRENEERLLVLLGLADRYELVALREDCASLLAEQLTEANMAAIIKVADLHQAAPLRAAALEFITARVERIAAVMDSDDATVRKSVRDFLATTEAANKMHSATASANQQQDLVTLTV